MLFTSLDNLATFCRTLGDRPLFVMTPNKIDLGNELPLKGGLVNESNGNADRLLAALRAMPALDTRKDVSETPDDIARNFFATDHHWNFTGAFKAFPAIARRICRELDIEPPDLPQFEAENWQQPFFDFVDGNYAVDGEGHEIGKIEEIGIKPSTSPFNRRQIINNLVPGSDVRVSVGKLEPREGRPDSASLILYNSTHKKVVSKRLAYANLGQTQTFIFHVPEKPGRYSLLAYAGKAGMTDGIGVVWRDIVIEGTKSKDKKPQGQEP